jgi:hypothetical protein
MQASLPGGFFIHASPKQVHTSLTWAASYYST